MKSVLFLCFFFQLVNSFGQQSYEAMEQHVFQLSSPEMGGRRAGTEGEKLAADYIKSQFQSIGLTPLTPRYYQSFSIPSAQDSLDTQKNSLTAKNVIGFIDNDKEETIVIGAHYDHLGRGFHTSSREADPTDKIHYGADDNASGVALMLNLADYFENNEVVELTNFVFIAFSAEEIGLIGSKFWCENSGFDLKSIKAMINLDMVGRLDPSTKELFVFGTGTSNHWNDVLDQHNTRFELVKDSSGIGPSDHASFYLENIPAVHFFTGQHEDYHTSTDTQEKINYEGMLEIHQYLTLVIDDIAQEGDMKFLPTTNKMQSKRTKLKVTLGVMPSYGYPGPGLKVDAVIDGKPAALSGMQDGDIILTMNGQDIADIYTYMEVLGKLSPGEQMEVIVKRNDTKVLLNINL
ncbi:MAG: M28 family peptidase [Crocinitomicaceae bacterium]|nr:M28 family peptidase [Crocinitomicaceae bacterium]